ncbi:MAG: hypothetical protein EA366_13475 [Spirulina sp. DLM2.Bin59]|nr:MAG: hypothetical protein EA366_13475 [Spirulina sp. DLM2.Bin59]
MHLPPEPTMNDHHLNLAGFRLQRFEVLNWGTFDQRPWVLELQGNTALLTGKNGSGKSTLVDGLLTLLVPNRSRNYNQASTSTGKKERSERSYIQGAYSQIRSDESYGSKPKLLRQKGTVSILLAYFENVKLELDLGQEPEGVTLAQVLWIEEGAVKKFFLVADRELAIASHFSQFRHISDLKKQLKTLGAEVYDQFSKYNQSFRKRLGLQSEKALDLFNQTVSIKEVGGLNSFVRDHMLEKSDFQTKIRELQESYENLTISHTAIQNARKQLEALVPLTAEAEKYEQLKQEGEIVQQQCQIVSAFFAHQKQGLLSHELTIIDKKLQQSQSRCSEIDQHLEGLGHQEKELDFNLKSDRVGQQIQAIKQQIQQCQQEVRSRKQKAERYNDLANRLQLQPYRDDAGFYENCSQGEILGGEIAKILDNLQTERDQQISNRSTLAKDAEHLHDELASLRQRKNQIPRETLQVRDRLAADLGLAPTALPFIGELLQVREGESMWEGAIERLLRGFGLRVLVSEADYDAVNTYVHQTHLKGRFVYYRVRPLAPNPTQRGLDPQRVPHKLEIKQDHPVFAQWLQAQLVEQFNYVCCEDLTAFRHEKRALTAMGLIKHGGDRHEKDDRTQIGDRRNFILGWTNEHKIQALEQELRQVKQALAAIDREIQDLDRQRKQREQQKSWLQDFLNFNQFLAIDWHSKELDYQKLLEQQQELEASSNHLKVLQTQLETIRAEIESTQKTRDTLIGEMAQLENRQSRFLQEQQACVTKLVGVDPEAIATFAKQRAVKLRQYSLTLATITEDENDLRDYLQDRLRQMDKQQESSASSLTMQMWNFKTAFPEITSELGTNLDYLDEYLQFKAKVEQEDLPRHERRFKELMEHTIIDAIVGFKSRLEMEEEEIRDKVNQINQSLQRINYTDSTYIYLCCEASRNREIRDFKQDLMVCLGNVAHQTPEANEIRFKNIQDRLIKRFKQEERWTSLVTDVRNWLDFSVSERYQADHEEKEHHTDSSGKSGGQKVKLAYTILASAIAYQFGLNQAGQKSFRFVVIDEAFSKSDDNNACYVMELFKNLGLQLLVITPKDKINVIEPYIHSLHFVANTPEGDCSSIASITIEKYRENRRLSAS